MAKAHNVRRAMKPDSKTKRSRDHLPTKEELEEKLKMTKWGKTFLTQFLDRADRNTLISYCNLRGYFEVFENLAKLFVDLLDQVSWSDENDLPLSLLLGRTCGSFLAAIRLLSGTQPSESYAQLRVCLESALYAFNIHHEPALAKVWVDRHNSDEKRKECKRKFSPQAILKLLTTENRRLAMAIARDYEGCIDFGAHPNERSVFPNLRITGHQGRQEMQLALLNPSRAFLEGSMLVCARAALSAIKIYELVCPDEWRSANATEKVHTIKATLDTISPGVVHRLRSL
jgi:hypothetical protein